MQIIQIPECTHTAENFCGKAINNDLNNSQNTKERWNTFNQLTNKAEQSLAPEKLLIVLGFLTAGVNCYNVDVGGPATVNNRFSDVVHPENSP